MMMSKALVKILLPVSDINEAKELIASSKKIQAIKLIRDKGKIAGEESISLKHAKYAADHLQNQKILSEAICVEDWHINSIIVSGHGSNKVEMDLDTLQMHFLSSLKSIGIEEVNHLLDLVSYIQSWQGSKSAQN